MLRLFFLFLLFLPFEAKATFEQFLCSVKNLKSAVITFTQLTKIPVAGDEVSLYEGEIFYKKPLKFKWRYVRGSNLLIVSNGTMMEVVFPDDGDCEFYKLDKSSSVFPLIKLLDSPFSFKKFYSLTEKGEVAVAVPKFKDSYFKKITFYTEGSKLKVLKVLQSDGTEETYVIKSLKLNVKISDLEFKFVGCR